MMNLGIKDLEVTIAQGPSIFVYCITFVLDYTGRPYSATGSAASPTQCFYVAMAYLAGVMREAV